jgi:hypothetical protein
MAKPRQRICGDTSSKLAQRLQQWQSVTMRAGARKIRFYVMSTSPLSFEALRQRG